MAALPTWLECHWSKAKLRFPLPFVIPPTQIGVLIGGKRVTCRSPFRRYGVRFEFFCFKYLLWDGLGAIEGNNSLNFGLARDQIAHLKTAANLYASRPYVKKPLKSGNVSHQTRHSFFKKRGLQFSKNISDQQRGKFEHIGVFKILNLAPKMGRPRSATRSSIHRQQFRSQACSRRAVSQQNVCKHGHRFYKEMYGRRVKIVNIRNYEIFLQCAGPGY